MTTGAPSRTGRPSASGPRAAAGPRVAALLAGDVDMIENPPIQDFDRVKQAGLTIVQGLSNRIIYVHLDQFISAPTGRPRG